MTKNLKDLDFIGLKSVKKGFGRNKNYIKIPPEVGEIDYLGYSIKEKLLLIGECKMVQSGTEAKFFRDDLHKFVNAKKSYLFKYKRKVDWIKSNIDIVIDALNSSGIYERSIEPKNLATAIITFYPSIVEYFIDEFPCVSITNLMLDYKRTNIWPYTKGVYSLTNSP